MTFQAVPQPDSTLGDSTLRDTLVDLFGPYTPRTESVSEFQPDGTVLTYDRVVPGLAGLDYEWFASVGLFSLVLFCLFRLLGGVFKQ